MTGYVVRRLLQGLGALLGAATLVFIVLRLSGDPTSLLLPPQATAADRELLRQQLGLDHSLVWQYVIYVSNLARGDLGQSFLSYYPVLDLTLERLPYTLALAGATLVFVIAIALPLGIAAARQASGWVDRLVMLVVIAAQAVPAFVTGTILIIVFAVWLHWLPSSGAGSAPSLILPVATLGIYSAGRTVRLVRSGMVASLREEYILAARARGLSEAAVVFRHALRNAMIPAITMLGLEAGGLLGRAVVVEVVFGWPGLGRLIVDSALARDYAVAQGAILILAAAYVVINLVVDVLYRLVDPRLRAAS